MSSRSPLPPLVVLGAGYTGGVLYRLAAEQGRRILASSRSPDARLRHIPLPHRLLFDLARPDTWLNLPSGADVIWCFPAVPLSAVQAWVEQVAPRLGRLVVLGSTSAYNLTAQAASALPNGAIDESAPIDLDLPRVQGEEYLRGRARAVVLRLAGIYGPGRNPLDWIRDGRVAASPKSVNLVHVEDVGRICLLALERGRPGETYNVSDGQPRLWAEICEVAERRWGVRSRAGEAGPGKRLSNAKLRVELGYEFRYPDLYAALDQLESGCG